MANIRKQNSHFPGVYVIINKKSFFWYAVRTDKDIMKLRQEILFN